MHYPLCYGESLHHCRSDRMLPKEAIPKKSQANLGFFVQTCLAVSRFGHFLREDAPNLP